ncbi:hypothetical protein [Arhodomonas sp. AD133]|uniref:hypothetical protein n=1 Tax=Arhodomonas sp. AD133 TaxID=3415009 RepID=UPI003EBEB721
MTIDAKRIAAGRSWLPAILGIAAAVLVAWLVAAILGSGAGLAWINAEWPSATTHLRVSVSRLLEALVWAAVGALPLALAMRRWQRVETAVTPLLLTALAVPWVLVAVALNMMVHLRLDGQGTVVLAACGGGAWLVGGLAPRQRSPGARRQCVQRAVRTALFMLLTAEVLSLGQGLGSQIRFYVLYWSPALLLLYGGLAVVVIVGALMAGRLAARPLIAVAAMPAGRRDSG